MDISQVRRANLLLLYGEFITTRTAQALAADPSAKPVGLDMEFASQIQVHKSYLSGLKSGGRQIGPKLARQIESLCGRPKGWLDLAHEPARPAGLDRFLHLAERAYLQAPGERTALTRALRAAIQGAKRS